jgi:hypothetical protein
VLPNEMLAKAGVQPQYVPGEGRVRLVPLPEAAAAAAGPAPGPE